MKIGKPKVDDVDYKNGKANTWGFWSVRALSGEGQRLLKLYPEYYVLKKTGRIKQMTTFTLPLSTHIWLIVF